jgi:hypothetical protein
MKNLLIESWRFVMKAKKLKEAKNKRVTIQSDWHIGSLTKRTKWFYKILQKDIELYYKSFLTVELDKC